MGKKARRSQKDKQASAAPAHKAAPQKILSMSDPVGNEVSVPKDRKCTHLGKGIDFEKLSSTFGSLGDIKCVECMDGVADRRTNKGKGKGKGNKKPGSNSHKAVWICLQCGQLCCGGIGSPTTPLSHALRHTKQTRHPLVIQFENPRLRWCFPCGTLIPVHNFEANEEKKDILLNLVKQMKLKLATEVPPNVDDAPLVNGSNNTEIKLKAVVSNSPETGHMVRGLVNLGNTCFFNSVMQNLLAMNKLRTHYTVLSEVFGPLTVSLKKLFAETISGGGARSVVNPRSLFGYVTVKSPQFRGYQQQDSHELLRCLLDGLCIEELSARKDISSSDGQTDLSNPVPTFVEAVFGGCLSSTISCFECGHSSTVYEPFLDLSLPLPTKKQPPKKSQSVSRGKKAKLPPKRIARTRLKATTSLDSLISNNKGGNSPVETSGIREESVKALTDDSTKVKFCEENENKPCHEEEASCSMNYPDTDTSVNATSIVSESFQYDATLPNNEGVDFINRMEKVESSNDLAWMDYLESDTLLPGCDEIVSDHDFIQSDATSQPTVDILCNTSENELPMQPVDDSQVILLPYEECSCSGKNGGGEGEVVSSTVDQGEWDGFGDLFNEPDVAMGPAPKPVSNQTNDISSESDGDEFDSDSPVSIESCLSYFIKPELLSGEHAWHCENCSRILQEQKMKSKKMKQVSSSEKLSNGYLHNDILSTTNTHGETNIKAELNPAMTEIEEGKQEMGDKFTGCNSVNNNHNPSHSIAEHLDEPPRGFEDGDLKEDEDPKSTKVKRNATKRMLINKTPPLLTIHLKRFSQDARGRLSKLSGHVSFKDVIDLGQYIDQRSIDANNQHKYHLLGVVEHQGTMRGGHYVAYVRASDDNGPCVWYEASDAYVREVSMEEVLQSEAYILFYEKI